MHQNQDMDVDPLKFSEEVEELKIKGNLSYIESTMEVSSRYGIDPEDIKKYILPPLLQKLSHEAQNLNLLKERRSKTQSLAALLG